MPEDLPERVTPAIDKTQHPKGKPYSLSTYNNYKCRCVKCKEAHSDYWRAKNEKTGIVSHLHPEGKSYSVSTYNRGCRCDKCKAIKANDYRIRSGKPPRHVVESDGTAILAPMRPPGWCWVDNSGLTQVVRCERCDKNFGTWVDDAEGAALFAAEHRNTFHHGEKAFDWSKWEKAYLVKNPGGRPVNLEPAECSEDDCYKNAMAKGLCMAHYQKQRRAAEKVRKVSALEKRLEGVCKPCWEESDGKSFPAGLHEGLCGRHYEALSGGAS